MDDTATSIWLKFKNGNKAPDPNPPNTDTIYVLSGSPSRGGMPATSVDDALENMRNKVSTLAPGQSYQPKNIYEDLFMQEVRSNPSLGRKIDGGNKDPLFLEGDGFQKMKAFHKNPDGSLTEVHYQYNKNTGKVYDLKLVYQSQR